MDSDTFFTLIWAPISVILALIGGYYIYKDAKNRIENDNKLEYKNNKKDKS